jgi:ribonuclease BN (tRNA processing enzyme)
VMLEATLLDAADPGTDGHLTARQAGELARAAGARRLVATHYSDESDRERVRSEAEAGFGGPVTLARAGDVYDV